MTGQTLEVPEARLRGAHAAGFDGRIGSALAAASSAPHAPRDLPGVSGAFLPVLDFSLPPALEASEPAEARGLERDQVRLMVSASAEAPVLHTGFRRLPEHLRAGDVLVVNSSATRNAAVLAVRPDGSLVELHFSTQLGPGLWSVELRRLEKGSHKPLLDAAAGESLLLPGSASVELMEPFRGSRRLWRASVDFRGPQEPYFVRHGFPIRYGYVRRRWPASCYQTIFAHELGSAEMPSAARPFTPRVLAELEAAGVVLAQVVLHTGVASLEEGEPPYQEFYRIPAQAAQAVNWARGRVVAVGTTVVRALESAADGYGRIRPGEGWTDLLVTPRRGVRAVDGLLTGLHEPRATHLAMLEAIAGRAHLAKAYAEALRQGYLWHEFGDLHLILPG